MGVFKFWDYEGYEVRRYGYYVVFGSVVVVVILQG